MEIGRFVEFKGVSEEILSYFRSTFNVEASGTVQCVQQLLKCLFGTNLIAKFAQIKDFIQTCAKDEVICL